MNNVEAASFSIKTKRDIFAIGHPIDVTFSAVDLKTSVSNINLAVLEKNFVVHDYNITKSEEFVANKVVNVEKLVVRLFPRQLGKLSIPAFRLGQYTTNSKVLTIVNDLRSTVQIRTSSHKQEYWQREPFAVYVEIFHRGKPITVDMEELSHEQFIIQAKHKSERFETRDNEKYHVQRFSWIVIPLTGGKMALTLPMIKTGGRRMYPAGNLRFSVKPLPAQIPVSVPVARPTITSMHIENTGNWVNHLFHWEIVLTGNGLSQQGLEQILEPLLEDKQIQFYPMNYSSQIIQNGTLLQHRISIPFKPLVSGELTLPTLRLPYVQPQSNSMR